MKNQISNLTNKDAIEYGRFKGVLTSLCPQEKIRRRIFSLIKKYQGIYEDSRRMVICLNKERKTLSKKKRDDRITSLSNELHELFNNSPNDKTTAVEQEQKIDKIFDGYKRRYKKFFHIQRDDKTDTAVGYCLDKKAVVAEEKSDGIFILTTNRFDLDANKVVDSYKNLREIEILFDDLKNFVDVRPVRHWLERRVRAHVFICILSLLLKRIFEINYLGSKAVMIPLEEISKSKLIYYRIKCSEKEQRYLSIPRITNITNEQDKFFKMVGIRNPMSLENYVW